jgi:hypothetical protein
MRSTPLAMLAAMSATGEIRIALFYGTRRHRPSREDQKVHFVLISSMIPRVSNILNFARWRRSAMGRLESFIGVGRMTAIGALPPQEECLRDHYM